MVKESTCPAGRGEVSGSLYVIPLKTAPLHSTFGLDEEEMMASVRPPLSRKSLILPALLFAFPLALAQGVTIFFFGFSLITLMLPWFVGMLPWLLGMPIGFVFIGGLCSLRTTRNVPDETTSEKQGRFSGFLTGLFSSLLGLLALVLMIVWYTNWWIPTLSTRPPLGCVVHVTPLSCMSPQAGARFNLLALPMVILVFLLGNSFFAFFAVQSGALIGRLRARRELNMRPKERHEMPVGETTKHT